MADQVDRSNVQQIMGGIKRKVQEISIQKADDNFSLFFSFEV